MSIIRSHDITLYGGNDEFDIVLRPLTDEHLSYLYKWNTASEVLCWTEGGTDDRERPYDAETVHQIYGGVSQNALCFLVEADGVPVGECRLQRMNLPEVRAVYAPETDVRRIDMAIGEKAYRNRGIGTAMLRMLVEFAFADEHVDVLHCVCEDCSVRSRRVWEKLGFALVKTEALPQPQKGRLQHHWRLTREEFVARRRVTLLPEQFFFAARRLTAQSALDQRGKAVAVPRMVQRRYRSHRRDSGQRFSGTDVDDRRAYPRRHGLSRRFYRGFLLLG